MPVREELPHCDIILLNCSSLSNLNDSVLSILKHTRNCSYDLYIIYGDCDFCTNQYLKACSRQNLHVFFHQKGIEQGILIGKASYLILMDSNVIVSPDWLAAMLSCAESDPAIGSVVPFANKAMDVRIDMPSGLDFILINSALKRYSQKNTGLDMITGDGFCTLFKRRILDEIGYSNMILHDTYESRMDLSMKILSGGYRNVVAPDVYIYHQKKYQGATGNKDPLKEYQAPFDFDKQWALEPCLRQTYRLMRTRFQKQDYPGVLGEIISGIKKLPFAKRDIVTQRAVSRFSDPDKLKVTYVLPALTIAGGVLSVVQLVNELILSGVEAKIVALREYPEIYDWKFYFRPIIFKNVSELLKNFPKTDIVVATHFSTAPWVARLLELQRAKTSFYFLQDYESWFFPESDKRSRKTVRQSYEMIPDKVVKSDWLRQRIENDGFKAKKIRLGMDLLIFYPRFYSGAVKKKKNLVLLAMARPRTPRRGFDNLIKALTMVKQKINKLEIVLFGDHLHSYSIPFEFTDKKIISDQIDLARLYSKSDIFVDASDFQGFGRTALEAMACGAACVLTNVGGVSEYAENEENCLLVSPKKPKLLASAILKLAENEKLREKLIENGSATVKDYCHKREARQTYRYMEDLMENLENKI